MRWLLLFLCLSVKADIGEPLFDHVMVKVVQRVQQLPPSPFTMTLQYFASVTVPRPPSGTVRTNSDGCIVTTMTNTLTWVSYTNCHDVWLLTIRVASNGFGTWLVQSATDLIKSNWFTFATNVVAPGGNTNTFFAHNTNAQQFFRMFKP